MIAARCPASPARSCGDCLEATVKLRLFVDGSLSLCDALVGGLNVKSALKNVASAKFLLGGRHFAVACEAASTALRAFASWSLRSRSAAASGLDKLLCGFGGIDPLLRFERCLVRRCLSQFELLANNCIGDA